MHVGSNANCAVAKKFDKFFLNISCLSSDIKLADTGVMDEKENIKQQGLR